MDRNESLTLASSLDYIATTIGLMGLDALLDEDSNEIKYICDTLGITPLQAALFATILEKSDDDIATISDMISTLQVSKIRFLGFKKEIDELANKRLVVIRKRRNGAVAYRVSQCVVRAVENNSSIEPERLEGLSTRSIFNRFHNIFAEISNGVSSCDIGIQEIIDILNSNGDNSFVKATKRLGINTISDTYEMLLMFYMLHRNVSFNDNGFSIDEFMRILDDHMGLNEMLYDSFRQGNSSLQEKGLIEFTCVDGLEDREGFCIPEAIRRELLGEISPNNTREKVTLPKDELIPHTEIRTKKLYYNDEEREQVKKLTELLKEDSFRKVQERLEEKGLRRGFCCLFYGPAGTGKTETVMQIAKETGRDIFIVDMSRLRSKWVGDSEKNIKQVFTTYKSLVASCDTAPILLFNEADAIFGKRIKEESATDKMSNAIQNIILQEMETLDGILIATTNLTENFDAAFERRFLYKILFKVPSTGVKAKIWKSMVDDISEEEAYTLATNYGFTGGQIENITRKLDVDYILSGSFPDIDKIVSLCESEKIQNESKRGRIGF